MKSKAPKLALIEHVAAELACVFWETGRSQGMKSRYKNARVYALNNLEIWVPHAIKHLLTMLNNPSTAPSAKEEIYEALMERINDPEAMALADSSSKHALPDIDIAKLIPVKELSSVIQNNQVLRDYLPFKAKRH